MNRVFVEGNHTKPYFGYWRIFFSSLLAIVRKEVVRILRIWPQTLMPPMITISLYFVVFGSIIGSRISDFHGISYIEFISPGLIMLSVITNSYTNVSSSFFSNKYQRSIEEILVSPTPNLAIIIGYCLGGIFRSLLIACLLFVLIHFFISTSIQNPLSCLWILFLTSCFFSLAGLINGILASKFDDLSWIVNFVLTPMIYLGGVFYSVDFLPDWAIFLSLLNPIFYTVDALRYAFFGISFVEPLYSQGFYLLGIVLLCFIALFLIEKKIRL